MNLPLPVKTVLRQGLRALRRSHAPLAGAKAAEVLAQTVPDILRDGDVAPPAVVAAYYPLPDEMDVLPLLAVLRDLDYRTALPVTRGSDAGLVFRLCDAQTPMARSSFGVMEPQEGESVDPDVILVPLLGFDRACNRLGYGAGHYDRTLQDLRARKDVLAAGVAFDMQRVDAGLAVEDHDQPLDCVITEKGLYWPDHATDLKG